MDIMQVKIALVGKYTDLTDSYLSVVKVGQESTQIYKSVSASCIHHFLCSHTKYVK
jgi:CTP synthase (UTP-ammonia lyase)